MRPGTHADISPGSPPSGSSSVPSPAVLVLDDDQQMSVTLTCYFEQRGFQVDAATSVTEAKALFLRRKTWKLILSDYHLPDGTGWEFCCWLREQPGGSPPFMLMSGSVQSEVIRDGVDFLAKPFGIDKLESRLQVLLQPEQAANSPVR